MTSAPVPAFVAGNASASCFSIAARSRRAASIVTPDLSRPMTLTPRVPRASPLAFGIVGDRHHDVGNRAVRDGLLRRP